MDTYAEGVVNGIAIQGGTFDWFGLRYNTM